MAVLSRNGAAARVHSRQIRGSLGHLQRRAGADLRPRTFCESSPPRSRSSISKRSASPRSSAAWDLRGHIGHDRVQRLCRRQRVAILLFGVDLSRSSPRMGVVQKVPDLWVALLMANPLDAFRIQRFSRGADPAEGRTRRTARGG